jgi:hypothetical protein
VNQEPSISHRQGEGEIMFFGHIGVGLAAKPAAPRAPLGALLFAATAIDTLSGTFMITGIERVDPTTGASSGYWSHGLFMSIVWSFAGIALAYLLTRDRRTSFVIGLLVFSHWLLDFISHPMGMGRQLPPDIPLLFAGSPRVGLGLYNSVAAALITDLGLLVAGIAVYLVTTRPKDRTGTWGFWLLIAATVLPAASAAVPALSALAPVAFILLWPLGNWVDRHRTTKATVAMPRPA